MEALGSSRLKLKRANTHISSLKTSISRSSRCPNVTFLKKGTLSLPREAQDVAFEAPDIYALSIDPAVPSTWGQIIGDILTNLRASLDHVAWELAMQRCKETSTTLKKGREVKFPIRQTRATKPHTLGAGLCKENVEFFSPCTWTLLESFQPYNRASRPNTVLLGVLKELVNNDKHRIITPVLREVSYTLTENGQSGIARCKQAGEFLFMVEPALRDRLKPTFSYDVVVNVESIWPKTFAVSRFGEMHDFIRDEVVPAFEVFFK